MAGLLNIKLLDASVHNLRILLNSHIFFTPYFKAKTQWNKGMSDFYSGNSVNCVLLDVYLYEITKREK